MNDNPPHADASFETGKRAAMPADFLEPPESQVISSAMHDGGDDALIGGQLGAYEIRRVLGRGACGLVYEAWQHNPPRSVALKTLRASLRSDAMSRRFEHEAAVLGRLKHPGIAQIYEAGTADGVPFFALELVEGLPLTKYAKAHALDRRARLRLMIDVCRAVEYAHQRGVIHRDLKPGNILVDEEGRPKILDFGIARVTDVDIQTVTLETRMGDLIGTVPYMSPEQCAGDPAAVDTRSDVYALGVVSYELLCGRLPYDCSDSSLPAVLRAIQEDPPTAVRRELRGDLSVILLTALEKDPNRRYATATALADDLDRYLRSAPIQARPPTALYQLWSLARRYTAVVVLSGVLLLTLLAAGIVTGYQALRLADERDAALAAEQTAKTERAAAESVAGFLEDLFVQASPSEQQEREPRVRDLLDRGAARLDAELAEQPRVHARLATVLGKVYRDLGDYPRSTELLESALALRSNLSVEQLGMTLNELAVTATHAGQHDRAEALQLERLELFRRTYGEEHPYVALALNDVGAALFFAGDCATAKTYFEQALARYRQLCEDPHVDIARELHNLGSTLRRLQRMDEAGQCLQEALDMRRELLGDDLSVGLTLGELAQWAFAQRDLESAKEYLSQQVELYRRIHHDRHPTVAAALNDYAFLVRKTEGDECALQIYEEVLAIRRETLGPDHPDVAATLSEIGLIQAAGGDFTRGLENLQQALKIRRRALGDQHDGVASSLRNLASTLCRAGRQPEAPPLLIESYSIFERNHGPESPAAAVVANMLARVYDILEQPAEVARWRAKLPAD